MKKIVAMVMVAVMCCFMLVSCGDSKYVGTWKAEFAGSEMVFILEKDHTAKMEIDGESSDEDKIEWEVKDKKIILKDASGDDDSTMEFEIVDDKTISLTEGNMSVNFTKQ